ncbi:alpha-l-rhamnosidase [Colletotrichum truncatum]|uniref:Alpha-l-rhamnosidase n=1 Tax=Colletotrichum truncatum TaxID=5467 RepID=A0ACC3Z715_COLTU|nr:alpha-l-rhamnosidase [Colletotrichum truncatum]KAF6785264.1 alpha-l-rhamnosidase [Colletotrichum truncatum]
MADFKVVDVRVDHYRPGNTLGIHVTKPRLSWRFENAPPGFKQGERTIRVSRHSGSGFAAIGEYSSSDSDTQGLPWPIDEAISSREKYQIEVRVRGTDHAELSSWSEPYVFETGLLSRREWSCARISSPWAEDGKDAPQPEDLFRKEFTSEGNIQSARLYVTAQGIYEAEINGKKVGDYFLAPGWTAYDGRLQYQTYDITEYITSSNCIGIRVAEGWFNGRIGFEGGRRNIWGTRTALMAQLEIKYEDGTLKTVVTDGTWKVCRGPTKLAEIYDGEKYDATAEINGWSTTSTLGDWKSVVTLPTIDNSIELIAGFGEPVRRLDSIKAVEQINTQSGKTILDFGQNLVGYVRIQGVKGRRGDKVTLTHAEVIENGELGTRPLRECEAKDVYTLKGDENGESWEPRFSFHGFRYVQVDGWPSPDIDLTNALEAIVCHTDMQETGAFTCSDALLNQLFSNVRWSMRGNFLSLPTDCPQRDERLGWTGDLALFAPTATFIYDCFGILKNWLADVAIDQKALDGIPPMVSPNVLVGHKNWGKITANAIWNDVVVLAPWALYEETADASILQDQYESMTTWLENVPRNKTGAVHLWDFELFQLGDWLDPNAPPDEPMKALTDPPLVANAFLVRSLYLMSKIATVLQKPADAERYRQEAEAGRKEFQDEYVSANGRLTSDSQTAYALAIAFDLLSPSQTIRAGNRLSEVVRRNGFKIGTGFGGTPFICEALTRTGHSDVAYAMLLNRNCPSWLYPVTMGATTVWERWDSMLPDGTINPGDMTSFNHYAFGAVAKFLAERLAGLQRLEPGWKKSRAEPVLGAEFTRASASHITPYGKVSCSWQLNNKGSGVSQLKVDVVVPPLTEMEVILPDNEGKRVELVGSGEWTFVAEYKRDYKWPVKPLSFFPE